MTISIKQLPEVELEFQMFVMNELADKLINEGQDVIKLTIGISELPIPEKILRVFPDTIYDNEKNSLVYPQGLPELREAIAKYYNTQFHVRTTSENIVINVGTSAIYRNLLQLLCKPGLNVLLPKPYYSLYLLSAILVDANITFYDIDPKTYRLNLDSFRRVYEPDKTTVVILNNPGNPLGNLLTKEEIREINEIVAGNSFIIHDEIYNNTVFYSEYESPLAYLDKYREFNIITNAFSKGFRMYTKRIGYAILPDSLVTPMRILQQHTLLTCDPINQYGMIEALNDLESPKELMNIYRNRAEYTYEKLKGSKCNPIKPEGGFYIVLDCDDLIKERNLPSSQELALDILTTIQVATVPGTDFGIPNALRLSFCNNRYCEAIDRLNIYFRNNR